MSYTEAVLAAMSHIFAVLSAEALRTKLLSGLHDTYDSQDKLLLVHCNLHPVRIKQCYKKREEEHFKVSSSSSG